MVLVDHDEIDMRRRHVLLGRLEGRERHWPRRVERLRLRDEVLEVGCSSGGLRIGLIGDRPHDHGRMVLVSVRMRGRAHAHARRVRDAAGGKLGCDWPYGAWLGSWRS